MHILLILFVKINLSLFKLLANSYDIARILVIISHTFSSLPHSLLIFLFILCVDGTFNIKLSFSLLLICICCNSFINLYVYGASLHDKVYKFNIYFLLSSSLSTNFLAIFLIHVLCVYTHSVYSDFHRLKAIYCDEKISS